MRSPLDLSLSRRQFLAAGAATAAVALAPTPLLARQAREKMDAGADAVQLYTGLIYRGPALVGECVRAVARR